MIKKTLLCVGSEEDDQRQTTHAGNPSSDQNDSIKTLFWRWAWGTWGLGGELGTSVDFLGAIRHRLPRSVLLSVSCLPSSEPGIFEKKVTKKVTVCHWCQAWSRSSSLLSLRPTVHTQYTAKSSGRSKDAEPGYGVGVAIVWGCWEPGAHPPLMTGRLTRRVTIELLQFLQTVFYSQMGRGGGYLSLTEYCSNIRREAYGR